jgi:hypothetical protein
VQGAGEQERSGSGRYCSAAEREGLAGEQERAEAGADARGLAGARADCELAGSR